MIDGNVIYIQVPGRDAAIGTDGAVNVLKKEYSFFFFSLSQRKVSRLLRSVDRPLTF